MTGPDNFREAQLLLEAGCDYGCPHTGCAHEMAHLARAKVHSILALTAAVVAGSRMHPADRAEWQAVIADGEP